VFFVQKWTFPQRWMYCVQYQYFFILHFTYLGVRTHPTPPLPTGLLETHSLLGRSRKKCTRKSVSVLGQKGINVIWLRRILTTLTYFDRETEQTDGRRDTRPVLYISRYRRGEHNKPFNTRCGPKKRGHRLMTIILSNLNGFAIFSLDDSFLNLHLSGY